MKMKSLFGKVTVLAFIWLVTTPVYAEPDLSKYSDEIMKRWYKNIKPSKKLWKEFIEYKAIVFTEKKFPTLKQAFNYDKIYEAEIIRDMNFTDYNFIILKDGKHYFIDSDESIVSFINEHLAVKLEKVSQMISLMEMFIKLKSAELASLNEKTMYFVHDSFRAKAFKDAFLVPEDVTNISVVQKKGVYTLKAFIRKAYNLYKYEFVIGKDKSFKVKKLLDLVLVRPH